MIRSLAPRRFMVQVSRTIGGVTTETQKRFGDLAEARIAFHEAMREFRLSGTPKRFDISLYEEEAGPGNLARLISSATLGGVLEVSGG